MLKLFQRLVGGAEQTIKGSYLSVDIGTVAIKVAEIGVREGKPSIINYGIIESPDYLERVNGVIQTSSLSIADGDAARMLKAVVAQMGTKTKGVVATIPSFAVFTSSLDLPVMNAEEAAQAIPWQARSLVPLPVSEITIDWIPIEQFEDQSGTKMQKIFMVAIPNEQINIHRSIYQKAGLHLKMLEVEGISLARALTREIKEDVLILDIGALTTTIAIASQGVLKYLNHTDYGSNALTQSLAKGLGISVKRAEALKKQRGLAGMTGEYGLSTIMMPFIDVILNEASKSKIIFEKGGGKISKIILSGGGGCMNGFVNYTQTQLGISTEKANPWSAVSYPLQFAPLFQSIAPRLTIAVGAGIKPFI